MQAKAVFVFLLFLGIFAEEQKPYCSGEGETDCDETSTCDEDTNFRDIRMSTLGCCQRCVKKLGECNGFFVKVEVSKFFVAVDEECSEAELGQETLPSARCQNGLLCTEGHCKEYVHIIEVTEIIV